MHAIQKHTPTSRDRRIRPTTPPCRRRPSTARAGRLGAGRRRRRRHCAARERVPPTRTMFTLTAKCAVATPVAATRKSARAPRARGASSARERAGGRGCTTARDAGTMERAREGWREGGAVGGEYRRARWARERRVARVERAARGRAMRGGGCADETLKPERSRAGERSERVGRGRPLRGRVDARGESDGTVKATLRWWIRWETRR